MSDPEWDDLLNALHDRANAERAVAAVHKLQRTATVDDVPRLLALLKDRSFFVREAAAWPLSDLGVTTALPDLLEALHRGFQEGHDNDGLSAALADLAEASPSAAAAVLKGILASGHPHLREHAQWLLEFCNHERDA
jgi:HEAT repeat protein